METERILMLKESALKYIHKEIQLESEKIERLRECEVLVNSLNVKEEIKAILSKFKAPKEKLKEIEFTRAESKYEKIFDKFDVHYLKELSAANFDLIGAMQAIESGFDVDIGEEKLVTTNQFRNIVSDCWEGKELLSEQI